MKKPKTRVDSGRIALCEECGILKGSTQFNSDETFKLAHEHVRETSHRVAVPVSNIVSLGDPDK